MKHYLVKIISQGHEETLGGGNDRNKLMIDLLRQSPGL